MAQSNLADTGSLATLIPPPGISLERRPEYDVRPGIPDGSETQDRTGIVEGGLSDIARRVAACEPGEPIVLIGKHVEMDRGTGELSGFGVEYALGRLAGSGSVELDGETEEIVFPTSKFALLSRFSMRDRGDFSTLSVHADRLRSSRVLSDGQVSLEDMMSGLSLQEILAGDEPEAAMFWLLDDTSLTSVELSEVKTKAARLAIGRDEVAGLIEGLQAPGSAAERYYGYDFSLLRAILDGGSDPGLV